MFSLKRFCNFSVICSIISISLTNSARHPDFYYSRWCTRNRVVLSDILFESLKATVPQLCKNTSVSLRPSVNRSVTFRSGHRSVHGTFRSIRRPVLMFISESSEFMLNICRPGELQASLSGAEPSDGRCFLFLILSLLLSLK